MAQHWCVVIMAILFLALGPNVSSSVDIFLESVAFGEVKNMCFSAWS